MLFSQFKGGKYQTVLSSGFKIPITRRNEKEKVQYTYDDVVLKHKS